MATLSCISTTTTTATLTCSGAGTPSNTRYWYYVLTSSTAPGRMQYGYNTSTSHTITFTGLSSGTVYYAECRYGPDLDALREWANNGTTTGTYNGGSCTVITDEEVVYNHTLGFTTWTTSNRVYARVTLTSGIASYDIDARFLLDEARALSADIPAGSLYAERYWETSITPCTKYRVTLEDQLRGLSWYHTELTKCAFSWNANVKSGDEFSLKATGTGGWNDFTSQLKTKEQFHTGNNRTFTTAVKGGNFTAAMFNQAVNAINNLVSNGADGCVTRMTTVTAGDPVTAAAINQLANCLNE